MPSRVRVRSTARCSSPGALLRRVAVAGPAALLALVGGAAVADVDADDDAYEAIEGETLVVPAPGVLANDEVDDDGGELIAWQTPLSDVRHGTLELSRDGSFKYRPDDGFTGKDRFRYRASRQLLDGDNAWVEITVHAAPDTPPTITLNGRAAIEIVEGERFDDPGATAEDAEDDDLTSRIEVSGDVDTSEPGTYTLTYSVTDSDGNTVSVERTVTVLAAPDTPPTITLNGEAAIEIGQGDRFDDPGATAKDAEDGDLTSRIEVSGELDTSEPGTYTLTYSVTDSDGNAASVERTVTVVNRPPSVEAISDQKATENAPYELDLGEFVSDPDTPRDAFVYTALGGLPDGLELGADGRLTGVPALGSAAGTHRVRFSVSDGNSATESGFELNVLEADRTDLAMSISAAPSPVVVSETATWTLAVENNGATSVDNVTVEARFTGDAPFSFDTVEEPGCGLDSRANATELRCAAGQVAAGDTRTIEVSGSASRAGDVQATATAAHENTAIVDQEPDNNTGKATLSVTREISDGSAQKLEGFDGRAAAAGDFDADGYDDLAVATAEDRSVLIFFNVIDPDDSNKRALAESPVSVGEAALDNDIAVADIDGDSRPDLVTAAGPGYANRVFLNDGDGAFESVAIGGEAADGRAVTAADVDGDGFMDLIFANASPNAVYLNGGTSRSYSAALELGDGESRDVVVADLFGDTLPELVYAGEDGDATIYARSGETYDAVVSLPTGATTSVAAADFNNDGAMDLVFGRDTPGDPGGLPEDLVFLNTSAADASFFESDALGAAPTMSVLAEDVDLDGDADIFALSSADAHRVFVNAGDASGEFSLHARQLPSDGARHAAAGKFSVDDRVDLAIVGASGSGVFYNDGEGNLGLGDTDAPTIELMGEASVSLEVGEDWSDPGATATDGTDGDLSDAIESDADVVDTDVVGTYVIGYNVTDTSGNAADTVTRSVEVAAREAGGGGGGGAFGLGGLLLGLVLCAGRGRASGDDRLRTNAIAITWPGRMLFSVIT